MPVRKTCGAMSSLRAWRERLDRFPSDKIDEGLQNAFMERLARKPDIRSRFDELADRFGYSRKHVPYRDRREQLELVGDLRRVLAEACVDELEPDLVIMDEFQRFKDLLDGEDEVAVLAKTLSTTRREGPSALSDAVKMSPSITRLRTVITTGISCAQSASFRTRPKLHARLRRSWQDIVESFCPLNRGVLRAWIKLNTT